MTHFILAGMVDLPLGTGKPFRLVASETFAPRTSQVESLRRSDFAAMAGFSYPTDLATKDDDRIRFGHHESFASFRLHHHEKRRAANFSSDSFGHKLG